MGGAQPQSLKIKSLTAHDVKLVAGAARILVNPLCDRLLAGAALADEQDGDGTVSQFANHGFDRPHARADRLYEMVLPERPTSVAIGKPGYSS